MHVAVAGGLCAVAVFTGIFDSVSVQVGYEDYAEAPVAGLPAFLAMPFNSLVNVAYTLLGLFWLHRGGTVGPGPRYLKDVFAAMALLYGPVQWLRLWTQWRRTAVLDQWLTLPIFAWPVAWCLYLDHGWRPWLFLSLECISWPVTALLCCIPRASRSHWVLMWWPLWGRRCAPTGTMAAPPRPRT